MAGFLKSLFGGGGKTPTKPPPKPAVKPKPIERASAALEADDRAALIRRAREVHRAKRKIFDHLSDEDRAKLVAMAILTFLNDGQTPDSKK